MNTKNVAGLEISYQEFIETVVHIYARNTLHLQ